MIRREVLIAPGDIFNSVRVETTKKRLDNLGYFSKVETYPEDTGVAGRKDLIIQVEEKRTGSLNFGAGFSTVDNLVGFVEMTQGNFDLLNWPNFTGAGQKFRARIQVRAPAGKISFFRSRNPIFSIAAFPSGARFFSTKQTITATFTPSGIMASRLKPESRSAISWRSVWPMRSRRTELFDIAPTRLDCASP